MISVNEARKILSENSQRGRKEKIKLNPSLGLIAAEDIHSPIDVPSFDNSAMDGFAMKFEQDRQQWKTGAVIPAGDTSVQKVKDGEAVRIFTGAKMPDGADTVIPQELVNYDQNSQNITYSHDKIEVGSNVRLKGSQCKKGEKILEEGTEISPGVIGLLASVGLAEVLVYTEPSVACIITGNELKEVGDELKDGEIYNSNGPMLEALLKKSGIGNCSIFRAQDDRENLQETIEMALSENDVVILSGGISVGDYDFVKECLQNAKVEELFYKIKQRPGKPMFAGKKDDQWIFALPGNPASVLSCFNQYVKPCLRYMMGRNEVWSPDKWLPLAEDHKKKPGFTFFVKARTAGDEVEILGAQQSFNLQAFSTANCLVELEEDKEVVNSGTLVAVFDL